MARATAGVDIGVGRAGGGAALGGVGGGAAAPGGGAAVSLAGGLLSSLEDERDFCLRSIRDLEAERDAGDIDAADFEALRDSYTVRAAAALRQLHGGAEEEASDREPVAAVEADEAAGAAGAVAAVGTAGQTGVPGDDGARVDVGARVGETRSRSGAPRSWRKRALIGVSVLTVAGGTAWSVVASSATRLPGQEITGQPLGSEVALQSLQQAQQAVDRGDDVTAIKDYQKVLNSDHNQPEALTGEGWLLAQTQQPALLQQGLTMLLAAERAAPSYAPAHVYRGIGLLSEGDYADAIPELQWYLAHNPDPQLAPRVRAALQQAMVKAAAAKG